MMLFNFLAAVFAIAIIPGISGNSSYVNVKARKNNFRNAGAGNDPRQVSSQKKTCSFTNGLHTNLIRFITKEGFHRDIGDTLEVTVTNSLIPTNHFANGECSIVIYSDFKSDIYVDPYEIIADPILRKNIRVLNSWTDLENPAWQAQTNSSVFVQVKTIQTGNLISSEEIKMPIHFRYQKPASHSKTKQIGLRIDESENLGAYHPVNIPLPKILLRCGYWDSKEVQEQCNTVKLICSLKAEKSNKCAWAILPFNANSKGSTVFIPVGDSDFQTIITCATLLVIVGASVFIFYALVRTKNENLVMFKASKPHSN